MIATKTTVPRAKNSVCGPIFGERILLTHIQVLAENAKFVRYQLPNLGHPVRPEFRPEKCAKVGRFQHIVSTGISTDSSSHLFCTSVNSSFSGLCSLRNVPRTGYAARLKGVRNSWAPTEVLDSLLGRKTPFASPRPTENIRRSAFNVAKTYFAHRNTGLRAKRSTHATTSCEGLLALDKKLCMQLESQTAFLATIKPSQRGMTWFAHQHSGTAIICFPTKSGF